MNLAHFGKNWGDEGEERILEDGLDNHLVQEDWREEQWKWGVE